MSHPTLNSVAYRCKVTGNPSGTDTWGNGFVCPCEPCVQWLRENQIDLSPEDQKIIHENFWKLLR